MVSRLHEDQFKFMDKQKELQKLQEERANLVKEILSMSCCTMGGEHTLKLTDLDARIGRLLSTIDQARNSS
jgi:hypothetical protein